MLGGLAALILGIIATIIFVKRQRVRAQARVRQEMEFKPRPFGPEIGEPRSYENKHSLTPCFSLAPPRTFTKGTRANLSVETPGTAPSMSGYTSSYEPGAEDVSAVPALLARLNNILSRYPRTMGEDPPEYNERV